MSNGRIPNLISCSIFHVVPPRPRPPPLICCTSYVFLYESRLVCFLHNVSVPPTTPPVGRNGDRQNRHIITKTDKRLLSLILCCCPLLNRSADTTTFRSCDLARRAPSGPFPPRQAGTGQAASKEPATRGLLSNVGPSRQDRSPGRFSPWNRGKPAGKGFGSGQDG